MQVQENRFYFIKDEYYEKFSDCNLAGNKGSRHNRPCFSASDGKDIIGWCLYPQG